MRDMPAAIAFVALPALGLWAALPGTEPAPEFWAAGLAGYLLTQTRGLKRGTWILMGVFTLTVLGAWIWGGASPGVAIARAGPITALLASLALLGRAAGNSPDIVVASRFLATRAPRSRYLALSLGTHLFAILLNFGAVMVMTALLAKGRDQLTPESIRRSGLAILRGFASMPFWSPLALSVVVTISILPGVDYRDLWPWGIGFAALYLAGGMLLERGPAISPRGKLDGAEMAGVQRGSEPALLPGQSNATAALARVALRAVFLMTASFALLSAGFPIVAAVLVASLALALPWLAIQRRSAAFSPPEMVSAGRSMANEIVVVGGAAFAGAAIVAGLSQVTPVVGALSPPQAALAAALLPSLIAAGGAVALNPIVTASLLLGLLQTVWPPSALDWLALGVIFGWGITAAGTPFTATVMIAARILDRPPEKLAYSDNATLTLGALVVAGVIVAAGVLMSA
jgi:hypothetical protein